MILIISNRSDATADFLQGRLVACGAPWLRLNTEHLADQGVHFLVEPGRARSRVSIGDQAFDLDAIAAIYYRRPVPPTIHNVADASVAAWMQHELRQTWGGILMASSNVIWMNKPWAISAASYKPEQLSRAAKAGLQVPATLITNDPSSAVAFCRAQDWNVVTKPIGHGEIRGDLDSDDRLVYTSALSQMSESDFSEIAHCPTMLQAQIRKRCDVRVTVVGTTCLAVALHSQERHVSAIDCRRDNMNGMRYSIHELPSALSKIIVALVESYDLLFGAVDLVLDREGTYWFLEMNPAGQWAWLEEQLGVPISSAITRALVPSMSTVG